MDRRDTVGGLRKGLSLLRALNSHNNASVLDLSQRIGLPRPTVYRLLRTLSEAGYVERGAQAGTFRLTIAVRGLSAGYSDEAWVSGIAAPILEELRREIVWPSDIATYERGAMLIRETTNSSSPLAMLPERAGHRPPVLSTSLGRAYFCFSEAGERASILEVLSAKGHREREVARDRAAINRLVRATRAKGYAWREGGQAPGTTSIAIPIRRDDRVLAALNIICISSAVSLQEVVRRYLGPMRKAAARMEAAMAHNASLPVETPRR